MSEDWHFLAPYPEAFHFYLQAASVAVILFFLPMKIKSLSTKIISKMLLVCQSEQLYHPFKKSIGLCLNCASILFCQQ